MTKASTPEKPALNLNLELPTNDNSPNLLRIRHSTAHVMAMAVQRLFPKVKVTIGPWIDNGYN
jgi:threonyl-tRNA synthetase